jgi:peptide/nickel transport system substrate-binding protein
MKRLAWLTGAASAALMVAALAAPAVAQDGCVRVLGYEWSGEKQSMDPSGMWSGDEGYHIYAVYNRLLDVTPGFELIPELATEWSVSDDGKTWTFKLREGVKFHDGSDFDAADVVHTFTRFFDPAVDTGAKQTMTFLNPAEGASVTAVDAHTVAFTTKEPVGELPLLITNKFTNIVADGAKAEDLRLHGNGTGPFMQDQFTPNAPVRTLKKNPNYWKEGLPKADCLRITVAQEPASALTQVKAGEVDLVLNVDPAIIPALKDDPNVELLETAASNSMTLSMWVDEPPFDKLEVRQALKLVADRQALVDTVLLGYGEVGNDNPVPLGSPFAYTKDAPARDIEKAKSLLAAAGYNEGNPLKIELYTGEGVPGLDRMSEAYAEMAKEAGIEVTVMKTPPDSYWDTTWLHKSFLTSAWSMRPPGEGLAYPYRKISDVNETRWKRDDFDALLDKASTAKSDEERIDYYKQAQKLLAEEGGVIIPMFVHQVLALRKGCTGYEPHPQNFNLDFSTIECGQ